MLLHLSSTDLQPPQTVQHHAALALPLPHSLGALAWITLHLLILPSSQLSHHCLLWLLLLTNFTLHCLCSIQAPRLGTFKHHYFNHCNSTQLWIFTTITKAVLTASCVDNVYNYDPAASAGPHFGTYDNSLPWQSQEHSASLLKTTLCFNNSKPTLPW